MDKVPTIDKKMLAELDLNPRISTTLLAKKLRISQQLATYHLSNLLKRHIITNVGAVINYHLLGFQQYRILAAFSELRDEQKKYLFDFLSNHHSVYWAASIGADWDFIIVIITPDYFGLTSFLTTLQDTFKGYIRSYTILRVLYQEFHHHKYLHPTDYPHPLIIDSRSKRPSELLKSLDITDYHILHILKNNARTPFLEIGRISHVNYKTVQYRIKKMEKLHVIAGYRLFFKSTELGHRAYQLILSLSNYTNPVIEDLLGYVRYDPLVTQVLITLGRGDIYLHLRAKNLEEIQRTIIKLRNTFTIIQGINVTYIFEDILIDHFPMSGILGKKTHT